MTREKASPSTPWLRPAWRRWRLGARTLLCCFAVVFLLGAGCEWVPGGSEQATPAPPGSEGPEVGVGEVTGEEATEPETPWVQPQDWAVSVVEEVLPSVVGVLSESARRIVPPEHPAPPPEPEVKEERGPYGLIEGPPPYEAAPEEQPPAGEEYDHESLTERTVPRPPEPPRPMPVSGILLAPEGFLVTVDIGFRRGERVSVYLMDGRRLPGIVLGIDERTQIVLIRMSRPVDCPRPRLGDSDEARVGQWVVALGNPFGDPDGCASVGVLTAKRGSGPIPEGGTDDWYQLLQIDAAVDYRTLGGALANIHGELIGLCREAPRGQEGGMAVPINLVRECADQMLQEFLSD